MEVKRRKSLKAKHGLKDDSRTAHRFISYESRAILFFSSNTKQYMLDNINVPSSQYPYKLINSHFTFTPPYSRGAPPSTRDTTPVLLSILIISPFLNFAVAC